jgi:small subunit ribosomal protein S7e
MAALNKIAANSPSRQGPSELETSLANALYDLESNTQDLKASLRPLQFVSAREVRSDSSSSSIILSMMILPFPPWFSPLKKRYCQIEKEREDIRAGD